MTDDDPPRSRPNEPAALTDLPFTFEDLRAAVPAHCLRPSLPRSMAYLALDLAALTALYALALRIDAWLLWPIFWFAIGTGFWALFVLGHDCGHHAFSGRAKLDDWVGQLLHTLLLVPYHGWRTSHARHHQHTGNIDRDEAWIPLTETQYRELPWATRVLRYSLPLLALPFYLLRRTPGRRGSHFLPGSELFAAEPAGGSGFGTARRSQVITSSLLCGAMAVLLLLGTVEFGATSVAKLYLGPYLVFAAWLSLVTTLHHTNSQVPWYRDPEWTPLRGALATVDRRYGLLESVHHNAGCHLAHHLFPGAPHYRLREVARALQPVLGEHHRKSREPIWRAYRRAVKECRVVPDSGAVVYAVREPDADPA